MQIYQLWAWPEFLTINSSLRAEALEHPGSGMYGFAGSDDAWATLQLKFMESHDWFTGAGRELYQRQKDTNIQAFRNAFLIDSPGKV